MSQTEQDHTITALNTVKREPQRARVKVGRETVATLTWAQIDSLGLRVGQAWEPALAQRVTEAATYDAAYRLAMRKLNRRALSRRELGRKLTQAGHAADLVDAVADRLEELGLLDDRAYGQAVLRELSRGKAAGPKLMRAKLFAKGLSGPLVDELVSEANGERDSVAEARALAEKKLATASFQRLEPMARKRRLWGLLARRGFESDVIQQAVEAALKAAGGLSGAAAGMNQRMDQDMDQDE